MTHDVTDPAHDQAKVLRPSYRMRLFRKKYMLNRNENRKRGHSLNSVLTPLLRRGSIGAQQCSHSSFARVLCCYRSQQLCGLSVDHAWISPDADQWQDSAQCLRGSGQAASRLVSPAVTFTRYSESIKSYSFRLSDC